MGTAVCLKIMKLYINSNTNPYFNLAAEEYLLTHAQDDIIMLWRNEPSVIIGKNQNAFAEIDFGFVRENDIKVVRRLTGGGAVFHDLGNLNYTFISPSGGRLSEGIREGGLDFAHFTKPIIEALCGLGVAARLSGRNDIIVDTDDGERKISGNAQCVVDGTTLHHGTLLYSARMERLQGALKPDEDKLRSKGIASVRSRVANLCELLDDKALETAGDIESFTKYLTDRLSEGFGVTSEEFTDEMTAQIEKLAKEKYSTDKWNIGRFGDFTQTRKKRFGFGSLEADLKVEGGHIVAVTLGGDFFGERDIAELCKKLVGCEYSRESIVAVLSEIGIERYIYGANADEIAEFLL